ncbi:restriction endonuclease subunit S [Bacillus cereus]|nr:restriction endonuclease subunit S [Bacillus cereus]
MQGWTKIKIGELFKYTVPGEWGLDPVPGKGNVPVLRSTNFQNNGFIDYTDTVERYVPCNVLSQRTIMSGDILIEKSGGSPNQPAGRVVFCDTDFNGTSSNFIEIGKIKDQYDKKFVFYVLYYLYKSGRVLKYQQQTTGIINFKFNEYRSEEYIDIPILKNEQAQISNVLTKIDNCIMNVEKLISKYNRIKIGMMQDLLTKGIDERGNIRTEKTHDFKDSPIGRIPVEWDYKELKDAIILNNYLRKPISAIERNKIPGSYPYYGATGIIDTINQFRVEGEFVLMGEDGDHFLKWKSREMTILTKGRFNVSNHAHILKGNGSCLTKWIHYFFAHRDITYYLTRQGAGRFKLNKESLLTLPILVPKTLDEQQRICNSLEIYNKKLEAYNRQLSKLKRLKTGLMQELLTGKARVTDLVLEDVEIS